VSAGGVGDGERHVEHLGERLRQVGLPAAGRPEHQDVRLGQLDPVVRVTPALVAGLDALVVVVDRHRQGALGRALADYILVEEVVDLGGLGQLVELDLTGLGQLLFDDLVAEIDALVADVHAGSSDQFLNLLLALPAEGALEQVTAVTDASHVCVPNIPSDVPEWRASSDRTRQTRSEGSTRLPPIGEGRRQAAMTGVSRT